MNQTMSEMFELASVIFAEKGNKRMAQICAQKAEDYASLE